jgi:uncharacterized caspase-like protein
MSRLRRSLPLLPATIAVLVVLPLVGQDAKPKGKKYALLVGVRAYHHDKLPDLKYTEYDVEELAVELTKKSAGFDDLTVLTTSRGEKREAARPTAKNIRAQLKRILGRVTKHDTVLVALSGHGVQLAVEDPAGKKKDRDEGFFCPADARITRSKKLTELTTTLISLKELFDQLEDSGAGVKLLLVDACRNELGEGEKSLDADAVPKAPRGFAALFSCAAGQKSHETAKLGAKGHGVFFHFVLEGLRGEAKNRDGEVGWDDLTAYVRRQVPRTVVKVIREGAQQSPHLVSNLVNSPILVQKQDETELEPAKSFTNSIGMKLVLILKGNFKMGSPADEKERELSDKDSEFQHEVEISKPFYLGVYTVTQKQYKEVMGENPSWFSATGGGKDKVKDLDTDDFPVEQVSWHDAKKFCEKLSKREKEQRAKLDFCPFRSCYAAAH